MEPINYRIGLDIGITSVGWAILLNNSNNEPIHILDMGVRIFDKAENPKNGASLAGERRMARSVRRRIRRKRLRLSTIKKLFADYGLVDLDEFEQHFHAKNLENVYELRCKGLDELLTGEELAQVLLFIAKHRGFRSTRKAEIKQDKDSGKMLAATKANAKLLEEKKYQDETGNVNIMELDGLSGFIFSNRFGGIHKPSGINREIKRIVDDHNSREEVNAVREGREPVMIPRFSCHITRHTFCSRLCENETNVKVIQSVMGHKDIQTTLDIYAEVSEKKRQEVFKNLNNNNIF